MACPRLRLSKSQYIKGMQCPLALWYFKNRKDLIPEIDAAKQALFDAGHEVGELARRLYPRGVEIKGKFYEIAKFVNDTKKEIAAGANILFEAAACTQDGLYSRMDIIKKADAENAWELIEVKSSTGVKPYHLEDMAVQLFVFEQTGFSVKTCRLMYVNNGFVKNGPVNPPDYFKTEDITEPARDRQAAVREKINELLTIIAQKQEPVQQIGPHCNDPFECEFKHHCWRQIPDYSVYSLFKGEKLRELTAGNICRITDIPCHFALTDKQRIDIEAYKKNEIHKEEQKIKSFLEALHYPLYFLDYETLSHAIPLFDKTSPYQQVPFQFSLHVQHEPGGAVKHSGFLYESKGDPRAHLIPALIDGCGQSGSVLVYYLSFEAARNKEMAKAFPEYAEGLLAINERMVDLWVPFNRRFLYSPDMKSSASIKNVLPAFIPNMSYTGLEIKDGESASRSFVDCVKDKVTDSEKPGIFSALKIYCEQDTMAMVKLLEVLCRYAPSGAQPAGQMELFSYKS